MLPGACVADVEDMAQLSLAIGGIQLAIASHEAFAESIKFVGQDENIGTVESITVTLKEHVLELP